MLSSNRPGWLPNTLRRAAPTFFYKTARQQDRGPWPVSFFDVTRASGIDFHLTCGSPEKRYIMESMCGGVAVLDYDNDGWMDIFLVNGSTLEDMRAGKCHPRQALSQ